MKGIGFSTGCLYRHYEPKEIISFLQKMGVKVVEVGMGVTMVDSEQYKTLESDDFAGFDHVSIHVPKIHYGHNDDTKVVLEKVQHINALRPIDMLVVHPDIVEDWGPILELNIPVGAENMDNRKESHRSVSDMVQLFEDTSQLHMVLDVNHVYSNDTSMGLAKEFYKSCGERIKEIHLSGLEELHDPLFQTKQPEIINAIQNWDVPVVIESRLSSTDELSQELEYINDVLNQ